MTKETGTIIPNFKKTIQHANGYKFITQTWSGDYDTIKLFSEYYPLGHNVAGGDSDFPDAQADDTIVTANTLTRREANIADLNITIATILGDEKMWFCSLDMIAVPKDIRTWKPSGEGEVAPDLTIIQYWEGMKATEPQYYAQYKYREPPATVGELGVLKDIPEGSTKKLAEMIFQGVNNYTIHAPCLTIVTYDTAGMTNARLYYRFIDKQVKSDDLSSKLASYAVGKVDYSAMVLELADVWILTDFKATTQANGLGQYVMKWIGATDAREELYPEASLP